IPTPCPRRCCSRSRLSIRFRLSSAGSPCTNDPEEEVQLESRHSHQRRPHPRVTIVAPVYNEEQVIDQLLDELESVIGRLPSDLEHEVVIVDDGSTDGTAERLKQALRGRSYLRLIRLSRNFGHQAAVSAGIDHASGDVVFIIDGDLQDDPHVLNEFIEKYRDGADVVYAKRVQRKEGWWLRLAYAIHYRLLASMSSIDLPVDAGDFGLISRQVLEVLKTMPERQRYIRGLRAWAGFKQVGIEVERRPRAAGHSKYSFTKLLRLASDGILAFSVVPL